MRAHYQQKYGKDLFSGLCERVIASGTSASPVDPLFWAKLGALYFFLKTSKFTAPIWTVPIAKHPTPPPEVTSKWERNSSPTGGDCYLPGPKVSLKEVKTVARRIGVIIWLFLLLLFLLLGL